MTKKQARAILTAQMAAHAEPGERSYCAFATEPGEPIDGFILDKSADGKSAKGYEPATGKLLFSIRCPWKDDEPAI